jgi:hypothetical protein
MNEVVQRIEKYTAGTWNKERLLVVEDAKGKWFLSFDGEKNICGHTQDKDTFAKRFHEKDAQHLCDQCSPTIQGKTFALINAGEFDNMNKDDFSVLFSFLEKHPLDVVTLMMTSVKMTRRCLVELEKNPTLLWAVATAFLSVLNATINKIPSQLLKYPVYDEYFNDNAYQQNKITPEQKESYDKHTNDIVFILKEIFPCLEQTASDKEVNRYPVDGLRRTVCEKFVHVINTTIDTMVFSENIAMLNIISTAVKIFQTRFVPLFVQDNPNKFSTRAVLAYELMSGKGFLTLDPEFMALDVLNRDKNRKNLFTKPLALQRTAIALDILLHFSDKEMQDYFVNHIVWMDIGSCVFRAEKRDQILNFLLRGYAHVLIEFRAEILKITEPLFSQEDTGHFTLDIRGVGQYYSRDTWRDRFLYFLTSAKTNWTYDDFLDIPDDPFAQQRKKKKVNSKLWSFGSSDSDSE